MAGSFAIRQSKTILVRGGLAFFPEKPIHLKGAEGCGLAQKLETGLAKALRKHPVWQLARAL